MEASKLADVGMLPHFQHLQPAQTFQAEVERVSQYFPASPRANRNQGSLPTSQGMIPAEPSRMPQAAFSVSAATMALGIAEDGLLGHSAMGRLTLIQMEVGYRNPSSTSAPVEPSRLAARGEGRASGSRVRSFRPGHPSLGMGMANDAWVTRLSGPDAIPA